MDDEQYAQFVRRKMWERSAEGVEAAREAKRRQMREEEQKRRQQARRDATSEERSSHAKENSGFDFEIDASLRRGQQRREKKRWLQIWRDYNAKWAALHDFCDLRKMTSADGSEQVSLRNKIPWPVESGQRKDVQADEIERFTDNVIDAQRDGEQDRLSSAMSILKVERVKWHPDKIQQRYGFMTIDPSTMAGVTAVFQTLDRMFTEMRQKNTNT